MEPKSSPESFPQMPSPVERPMPSAPERGPIATPERAEPSIERGQERSGQSQPPVVPIPLPTPVPQTPVADDTTQDSSQNDNPTTAGDDDLIEAEWVNKAKKIIAETRDDPHRREQEVGKLQADYLRKRYGKELGSS
jgi:hypothetical protein